MNSDQIKLALKNGLATLEALLPIAAQLGGPNVAAAARIAASLAEVGRAAIQRFEDGQTVWTSDDAEEIKGLLARVQDENDQLAERVAAS